MFLERQLRKRQLTGLCRTAEQGEDSDSDAGAEEDVEGGADLVRVLQVVIVKRLHEPFKG